MAPSSLQAFADALTAADRRPPPGLSGAADRRFAVYRNNVAVGLIRALEARFPAVADLAGEEFFRAMARDFILRHPPASPLLMAYGDALPAFIAGFPPAGGMTYLADVARVEVAVSRASHAADVPRLGGEAFAEVAPGALAALRIELHPAVAVVRSAHPVGTILAMARGWAVAGPIVDWSGEAVLVDRPGLDVKVRRVPLGAAVFLEHLAAGDPLGAAVAGAASSDPGFDLAAALADLIGAGRACRIETPEGGMP